MGNIGWIVVAAAIVLAALLLRRVGAPPGLDVLSRSIAQLQSEIVRLGRMQEELRQDAHRGREASVLQLAEAAQGIRSEIGYAQRALAEVKAVEQGRAKQMELAAESLRRLETVVAGSSSRCLS